MAQQVAEQLMTRDALGARARDELGISQTMSARPVQATLVPYPSLLASVLGTSLVFLAVLGFISARGRGANVLTGAWRFAFWSALAMVIIAGAGALFSAFK